MLRSSGLRLAALLLFSVDAAADPCAVATLSSMFLQAYAEMAFVNVEFGSTQFWVLLLLDFCGWHARQ